jgi:hypothetical protein
MRGKAKASLLLAVDNIGRRGCAAAGVRLAGEQLSAVSRLDRYGTWCLLTTFETPELCILLLVAEHTRSASPYQQLYEALGIDQPEQPRTKPTCCDPKASRPSLSTSCSDSNAACESSPVGCQPQVRPAADGAEPASGTRHLKPGRSGSLS